MSQKITHQKKPIYFGRAIQNEFNEFVDTHFKSAKKVIITDETVYAEWMEAFISNCDSLHQAEIIQIPSGELNKTIDICVGIWETLSEYEIGRQDLIINFGGGMVTDLGGFVASTYKRGLKFINIPTTLLSQVDASVGGKTGIDLGPFKNQVGVFNEPEAVFIDYSFLESLPESEVLSGYAEMIKHGLIDDLLLWKKCVAIKNVNIKNIVPFIYESVEIKHQIVTQDPFEKNKRKALNFGHTIGHAIEGFLLSIGKPQPHGYAVAWGMIAESYLSLKKGFLSEVNFLEIKAYIDFVYPKCPTLTGHINDILQLMMNDKKNMGGKINFTFLNGIGDVKINQTIEIEDIKTAIKHLF